MRTPLRYATAGLALALLALPPASSALQFKDLLNKAKGAVQSQQGGQPNGVNLPNSDIASGLKEALAKSTTDAINTLGRNDGFWNNPKVRIPLPGKLDQAAKLARKLGQGDKVDAFQLSMNRAAEKAVPQVADIFGDAIRKMTLDDARGILTGGDHAATDYFRRVAGPALTERIKPIVTKATDSVGVTQKYKSLVSSAGSGQLGGALGKLGGLGGGAGKTDSLDLDNYVTQETLDGLFATIGNQEKSIRDNPAEQTTSLLKKVFGK